MPFITSYDGKLLFRCDECRSPRAHLAPCEGCIANLQRTTVSEDVEYRGPWLCRGCVTRHRNNHARAAQGLPPRGGVRIPDSKPRGFYSPERGP